MAMKKKSLVTSESAEARKQIIALCNPSKEKLEDFEQKIKQYDLFFDFWIIAKWAVNSYFKQEEINEHKNTDFQAVKDFQNDAMLKNKIDKIKSKVKGFSIEQDELKPLVTAYSPLDPNDTGRQPEPTNTLENEMMVRLDQAGLSNHQHASKITADFVYTFFGEYRHTPTIRANYLRFIRK
jgi:hypothetical protein